ncbi:hypothetical protein AA309_16935 [Microvirga vignae]|uniref:Uncharacterized protein n=1 Tax=Microvirga vignae TaxID=1225564 RepID=A0A0H1RA72_9HYPH|nr:hypothetical protein [Microvirga vignae]KLK92093.1 hypothetical protein AA309_16935 [Microvirga vignae]
MDRQLKGIVAATLAAPYVASLLMALRIVIFEYRSANALFTERFYGDIALLGTIGLFYAGLPTLILSLIAASILNMLKLRSVASSLLFGSVVGSAFGLFLSASSFRDNVHLMLIFAASGAICGWIYWRIAIRRTPPNGHAIEAE